MNFELNDLLMLSQQRTTIDKSHKLVDKFTIPYYITKCLDNLTYKLRQSDNHKLLPNTVNVSRLKKYQSPTDCRTNSSTRQVHPRHNTTDVTIPNHNTPIQYNCVQEDQWTIPDQTIATQGACANRENADTHRNRHNKLQNSKSLSTSER